VTVGLCNKVIGQVVNLGVGSGYTIRAVAKTILKLLGKEDMPIEQDPSRVRPVKSEVMRLISNNAIAREVCGWEPKYDLEGGLTKTIKWVRKNIKRYKGDIYSI
jgi:nucleoside-diphosphate-sugar epimerase